MKYIIDTAPLLNFLAAGEQNILIQYAKYRRADLCVPQMVDLEVHGHFDYPLNRFKGTPAEGTWGKVAGTHIKILPDDFDTAYGRSLMIELRFIRPPSANHTKKDLGEDMVMAHAAVLAVQGHEVEILLDERKAVERFTHYITVHLDRRFPCAGSRITFLTTHDLVAVCQPEWMSKTRDRDALIKSLARFDDGLVAG